MLLKFLLLLLPLVAHGEKILVLIIASDDFPVYAECQKAWRAYMHLDPRVEAYFLRADPELKTLYKISGDTIWSRAEECQFPGILKKTVGALKALSPRLQEFDYIIRTNLSSFFIFPRLFAFLKTLPKTNCYCGGETGPNSKIATGAGIILSPDVAKLLINGEPLLFFHYPRKFPEHSIPPDDAIIAAFLCDRRISLIPGAILHIESLEYWNQIKETIPESIFHIRVKTDDPVRMIHDPLIGAELLKRFYQIERKKDPFPIGFSISETKIVPEIPRKDRDFAYIDSRNLATYIYNQESDYYKDYQRSYFAVTQAKGGWDCMRHYEILANGCIPYFINLEQCPAKTMHLLPKKLILEAMHLPGVSLMRIDHRVFDRVRYDQILAKLLDYTRTALTTKNMARYILETVCYSGQGKILYLSQDSSPDYLRNCSLIGFKELLGDRVIDVPKIEHIYTSYPLDEHLLYGKGFTFTKIVEDIPVDRIQIEERIRSKEFDLVIYGSIHRGLPFHDLVQQVYPPSEILYLCGEDCHQCPYSHYHNLFLRESSDEKPISPSSNFSPRSHRPAGLLRLPQ